MSDAMTMDMSRDLGLILPEIVVVLTGVAALIARSVQTGSGSFLAVAVVLTFVNFISTSTIARFIEGQGR